MDNGGAVALVLTVLLDDGQEVIEIREDDVPSALAENFCKVHKLNASIVPVMTRFIEKQFKENEEPQTSPLQIVRLHPAPPTCHADKKPAQKVREQPGQIEGAKKSFLRHKSVGQLDGSVISPEFSFKPVINKPYIERKQTIVMKPRSLASTRQSSCSSTRLYDEAIAREEQSRHLADQQAPISMKEISLFKPNHRSKSKSARSIVTDSDLMSEPIELKLSQGQTTAKPSRPQTAMRSHTPSHGDGPLGSEATPKPSRPEAAIRSHTPSTSEGPQSSRRETSVQPSKSQSTVRSRTASKGDESLGINMGYWSIFEGLKPTKGGTLNCATMTRCNLTNEQANFLRPILQKLVASDHEMGFAEFSIDLARLQKTKGIKDLAQLFKPRGDTSTEPKQKKAGYASALKPKADQSKQIYSRQMEQQHIKQAFLRTVKKRLEAKELIECTFKPKIIVHRPLQGGASLKSLHRRSNSSCVA